MTVDNAWSVGGKELEEGRGMDRSDGEVEMARRCGRPCEPWAGEAGTDRGELTGRPEDEPAMGWSGEDASASGGLKERAMKRSRCVMEFMADGRRACWTSTRRTTRRDEQGPRRRGTGKVEAGRQ